MIEAEKVDLFELMARIIMQWMCAHDPACFSSYSYSTSSKSHNRVLETMPSLCFNHQCSYQLSFSLILLNIVRSIGDTIFQLQPVSMFACQRRLCWDVAARQSVRQLSILLLFFCDCDGDVCTEWLQQHAFSPSLIRCSPDFVDSQAASGAKGVVVVLTLPSWGPTSYFKRGGRT